MLSTRSVTSWTTTGCLQVKHHHLFENKKWNTFLGGSEYADSKKLTTVQPTAPGPSSLIARVLRPKLKNSFPNKQSTRTDFFAPSTIILSQQKLSILCVLYMQVNQVKPVMQLPSSLGRRWWNCAQCSTFKKALSTYVYATTSASLHNQVVQSLQIHLHLLFQRSRSGKEGLLSRENVDFAGVVSLATGGWSEERSMVVGRAAGLHP